MLTMSLCLMLYLLHDSHGRYSNKTFGLDNAGCMVTPGADCSELYCRCSILRDFEVYMDFVMSNILANFVWFCLSSYHKGATHEVLDPSKGDDWNVILEKILGWVCVCILLIFSLIC